MTGKLKLGKHPATENRKFFCPACNEEVFADSEYYMMGNITIECPHCGNKFHDRVDNTIDWSLECYEE